MYSPLNNRLYLLHCREWTSLYLWRISIAGSWYNYSSQHDCHMSWYPSYVVAWGLKSRISLCKCVNYTANTVHSTNVGLMLGQRRRRWPNINPTLVECTVFAGIEIFVEYVMVTKPSCAFINSNFIWTRVDCIMFCLYSYFPYSWRRYIVK